MRIAIVGIGNVGSALARALRRAHHTIVFGTRNPSDADHATIAEAAANADATILAVPFRSGPGRAGGFNGEALIDAINPFGMGSRGWGRQWIFSTSGAETMAAMAPSCSKPSPDGVREHGQRHCLRRRPC
jgi:hypothetical protein